MASYTNSTGAFTATSSADTVGNQAFQFIGTDGFNNVTGELRYEIVSGNTASTETPTETASPTS